MVPSLPLHNCRVLATRDPDKTCAYMQSSLRPNPNKMQLPAQPRLKFIHNNVKLNSLSLNSLSYDSKVNIKASSTENICLIILALNGEGVFRQDKWVYHLKPDDIYIINPLFILSLSLSQNFK